MKFYFNYCAICKKKLKHIVYLINRKHGIKLMCLTCNHKTQYKNLNDLKETKNEQTKQ